VQEVRKLVWALFVFALIPNSLSARGSRKAGNPNSAGVVSPHYDITRDPASDLNAAIALATKTNKKILLEVGGDWCVYCNIMDQTFDTHPQLVQVRDEYYVTVKVNYSKENPNQAFLSKFPKIPEYPHFFVLDSKGSLLRSQPTHPFEHGRKYNAAKIDAFLKKGVQPPRHWLTDVD
jgi:thiol:disulfide interchange protein